MNERGKEGGSRRSTTGVGGFEVYRVFEKIEASSDFQELGLPETYLARLARSFSFARSAKGTLISHIR